SACRARWTAYNPTRDARPRPAHPHGHEGPTGNATMPDAFLHDLTHKLRAFARERDWEQFHTPKNLAMALTVEAAELQEIFQWLSPEGSAALSAEERRRVGEEVADVLLYLLRLADVL